MTGLNLLVLLVALVGVTAVVALVMTPWIMRRQRAWGYAVLATSLVILGGTAYAGYRVIAHDETFTSAWVTVVPPDAEDFSLRVDHRRVAVTGDTYEFQTDARADEMRALLEASYPDGHFLAGTSDADARARFTAICGQTRINVTQVDDATWLIANDTVTFSRGNYLAGIAFPHDALDDGSLRDGSPTPLLADADAVRAELELLGADRNADGTYTVRDTHGNQISLDVAEKAVTAELISELSSE